MSRLIELKLKSKSGQINDLQVAEIISIDGRPYEPAGRSAELQEQIIFLDGRVTALERVIGAGSQDGV